MEEVSDRFIRAPRFRQRGGNITWSLTYVVKFLRKHVGSRRIGWKQQNSFCLWHFFPVFLIEFTMLSGNNTSTWRGKNVIVLIEIKWWAEIATMERLLLAGQSSYLTVSGPGWYKICTFVCDLLCCYTFVDHCSVNNSELKRVSLNKTKKIRCLIKQGPLWWNARFILNLLQISWWSVTKLFQKTFICNKQKLTTNIGLPFPVFSTQLQKRSRVALCPQWRNSWSRKENARRLQCSRPALQPAPVPSPPLPSQ